jgi:hypothetical protein
MDIKNNILKNRFFVFRNWFRVMFLMVIFPLVFTIILFYPPYIREDRLEVDGAIAIKKSIEWNDDVFHPPYSINNTNHQIISFSVDYIQWITLLSGIAFLNVSFYFLTKNDSKMK